MDAKEQLQADARSGRVGVDRLIDLFFASQGQLQAALRKLQAEGLPPDHEPVGVLELTLDPVVGPPPEDADAIARVEQLSHLGPVIVTRYGEGYRLADYLRRHTAEPIRFALGVSHLARLLEARFYRGDAGQLLEGFGKLLSGNVKIYAYPVPRSVVFAALGPSADHFRIDGTGEELVTSDHLQPFPAVEYLYRYLRGANWVISMPPE